MKNDVYKPLGIMVHFVQIRTPELWLSIPLEMDAP